MAQADCVSNAIRTLLTGASLDQSNASIPASLKDFVRFQERCRQPAISLADALRGRSV